MKGMVYFLLLSIFFITSCDNTREREAALQKKEAELAQKEQALALRENFFNAQKQRYFKKTAATGTGATGRQYRARQYRARHGWL